MLAIINIAPKKSFFKWIPALSFHFHQNPFSSRIKNQKTNCKADVSGLEC